MNVLETSDKKSRVEILKRNDGLFEFRAYVQRREDAPYEQEDAYYWSPTLYSGVYANVEDAERDALREVLVMDTCKQGH
ncbi:hypothetical protein [Bradyrhizobium sp. RDM4]|uniref:hypothetical protein n=1 Tax=Bradyrhizobium sp. RDM4 TaxID=3378765 RepID=UPI0038FCB500